MRDLSRLGIDMKNIILIGMPASGKSTVGVVLAKTLAFYFTDTDLVIQSREGKRLQDIIDNEGMDAFFRCEEAALLSLCSTGNTVISTGGSAVFSERGMAHLKQNSLCVYLAVSCRTLGERLKNIRTRGIAAKRGETIEEIFSEREPLYRKYADIEISADGKTVEELVEEIASEVGI